jgi:hypothetical protein
VTDNEELDTVAALLSTTVTKFDSVVTDTTVVPAGIPDAADTVMPAVGVGIPELGANVIVVDPEVAATV